MEWPRIPLPGWPDGDTGGPADELAASAARGRELAALLDFETPVPGVTEGPLRPEIAAVTVPSTTGGGGMIGDDFVPSAGWGHFGQGSAVMPGQGRAAAEYRTSVCVGKRRRNVGDRLFSGQHGFEVTGGVGQIILTVVRVERNRQRGDSQQLGRVGLSSRYGPLSTRPDVYDNVRLPSQRRSCPVGYHQCRAALLPALRNDRHQVGRLS